METIEIKNGDNYALDIASTALAQIMLTDPNTVKCWGVSKRICLYVNDMPAVGLYVNGFIHKGWVFVALNEGTDTYEVFTVIKEANNPLFVVVDHKDDIYCDMLTSTIDGMIEKDPSWTDEEYNSNVDAWLTETA